MYIPPKLFEELNLNPEWECYDNSTLDITDQCYRKAYWKLEFPLPDSEIVGIQENVGIGAKYGSCIHSAMDKYYSPQLYKTYSLEKRKIAAFRAFSSMYEMLIPDPDLIESPYTHPDGICQLDDYFTHYEAEDNFFIPMETELCVIVLVTDIDPPFYWISRIDGVIYRPAMNDLLVREFKTTKSSLQTKINELRISRQCEGYVWSLRQPEFLGEIPIAGVMADVLAMRTRERDFDKIFRREIFHVKEMQAEIWKRETLIKVERWRKVRKEAYLNNTMPLTQHTYFDRKTTECTRYGLCSYYDLCVYGLNGVDLKKFYPNDWNPLHAGEKMDEG